ncbi:PEP-CTERM sorting domain-containing protein [Fortiea contorta]|uniref:PEP-CTERM sorting domain-containing protein n=1 Tax=Fortiea contorta TaxID=1892405 RepID=UPI00037539EA|nr:PEP-CTERM sorting domain-containing protein [Fortiea contorta]
MKLTTKLGIMAASVALSLGAIGAKSAEAASIEFLSQSGNQFDYALRYDSANADDKEQIGVGSLFGLFGLSGVYDVTTNRPDRLAVLFQSDSEVILETIGADVYGDPGELSTGRFLFSIFSTSTTLGLIDWGVARVSTLSTDGVFDLMEVNDNGEDIFVTLDGVFDLMEVNDNGEDTFVTFFEGQTLGPVTPVPEPMTMSATAAAIGFGAWMKRKQAAAKKADN